MIALFYGDLGSQTLIVCQNLRYRIRKQVRGFARYLLVGGRSKNLTTSSVIKQQAVRTPLSGRGPGWGKVGYQVQEQILKGSVAVVDETTGPGGMGFGIKHARTQRGIIYLSWAPADARKLTSRAPT